jgi:hypothetical protein
MQLAAIKTLQIALLSTAGGGQQQQQQQQVGGGVASLVPSVTVMDSVGVRKVLNSVLLPLLGDLHAARASEGAQQRGMDDVQSAACSLLSQTFLLFVEALAPDPDFQILWVKVLGTLEKHLRLQPPAGESLREGVLQCIRNLVMVCYSTGVLDRVSNDTGQDVLGLTWTLIDPVCPDLQRELMQQQQQQQQQQI